MVGPRVNVTGVDPLIEGATVETEDTETVTIRVVRISHRRIIHPCQPEDWRIRSWKSTSPGRKGKRRAGTYIDDKKDFRCMRHQLTVLTYY
jgi:hypothetical protein